MKKISLILAACAGMFALSPSTAMADHRHHSHHSHHSSGRRIAHHCGSCGSPVYQDLRLVGYDAFGRPIYNWVTVGHACRRHYYRNEISVGGLRFRF